MLCPNCNNEIPNDSVFCGFCGEIIENKSTTTSEGIGTKSMVKPIFILIYVLMLIGIIVSSFLFVNKINLLKTENSTLTNQLDEYESRLDDLKIENDELSTSLSASQTKYANLQTAYTNLKNEPNLFNETVSYLYKSNNSNSYISTNSKIYCVATGKKETIKINWKFNGTMYMGVDDGRVVDAEWTGENVTIKGKTQGVTSLYFGSDSSCSQNRILVTVICY